MIDEFLDEAQITSVMLEKLDGAIAYGLRLEVVIEYFDYVDSLKSSFDLATNTLTSTLIIHVGKKLIES